jgi:exonuclease III
MATFATTVRPSNRGPRLRCRGLRQIEGACTAGGCKIFGHHPSTGRFPPISPIGRKSRSLHSDNGRWVHPEQQQGGSLQQHHHTPATNNGGGAQPRGPRQRIGGPEQRGRGSSRIAWARTAGGCNEGMLRRKHQLTGSTERPPTPPPIEGGEDRLSADDMTWCVQRNTPRNDAGDGAITFDSLIWDGMQHETDGAKNARRQEERRSRKSNRGKRTSEQIVSMATQNFNGIMGEKQMEEAYLSMKQRNIGILFGQEGRRPKHSETRWDSEELLVAYEDEILHACTNMKKDGNFFILSAAWKEAFLKGGKVMKRFCPRLVTMRLPAGNGVNIYLINAHWPDDSKPLALREAFQRRLETAISEAKSDDLMVMGGDWNACTGTSANLNDGVCGQWGTPYLNRSGRVLRTLAAFHHLSDLVTFHQQDMASTFFDHRCGKAKQLDRFFMREEERHTVKSCRTENMLVDSDHEAVTLTLSMRPATSAARTIRQVASSRATASYFGHLAGSVERKEVMTAISAKYNTGGDGGGGAYPRLEDAVQQVIAELPPRKRPPSGWCDVHNAVLWTGINERNKCSRSNARHRTEPSRRLYKAARQRLKKLKQKAKNEWLLHEIDASHASLLPGGRKRTGVGPVWSFVRKCKRG